MSRKLEITADTPLSALFRESHHEELKCVIDAWRPYLVSSESDTNALTMSYLGFDFTCIRIGQVYRDLARLVNHDALLLPLIDLARYLTEHTNLALKEATAYRQLKRYTKIYQ